MSTFFKKVLVYCTHMKYASPSHSIGRNICLKFIWIIIFFKEGENRELNTFIRKMQMLSNSERSKRPGQHLSQEASG